jgi:hypothetical protein
MFASITDSGILTFSPGANGGCGQVQCTCPPLPGQFLCLTQLYLQHLAHRLGARSERPAVGALVPGKNVCQRFPAC